MGNEIEREWTEEGEYAEMYSPERVYDLMQKVPRQVITTTDVDNELGCTRSTSRRKLRDLAMEGRIEHREPSGKITLWYLPEDDPETRLKRLSTELGEAITVGDTVYENGDKHSVEQAETS